MNAPAHEMLCTPGWPPVDAALWRRVVRTPALDVSADDYALLPEKYRGVVDRRRMIERGERPGLPPSSSQARKTADEIFADVDRAEDLAAQRAQHGLPSPPPPRIAADSLKQICRAIRAGKLHPTRINFEDHMLILSNKEDRAVLQSAIEDWLAS